MATQLPVLSKPTDSQKVETYTSQEELEALSAVREKQHQENLADGKKTRDESKKEQEKTRNENKKEQEKTRKANQDTEKKRLTKEERRAAELDRREKLKANPKTSVQVLERIRKKEESEKKAEEAKARQERLQELRELTDKFDRSFRGGILGRLTYVAKHSRETIESAKDVLKDSFKDLFLGKTLEDKTREAEGLKRNSLIKRIKGEEKYVGTPIEDDEEPTIRPKKPRKSEPMTPLGSFGDNSPGEVTVLEDKSADKFQVPLLQSISEGISGLMKILQAFTENFKSTEDQKARNKNAEGITSKFTKAPVAQIEKAKKGLMDVGLHVLAGISSLTTVLTTTLMGVVGRVGAMIVKAAPIATLALGLYLAVKDGIAGWFSAEAWGVSKISGFVGGLIGGLDQGVMGAIKNAGKWAAIGAGIGSFFPVVGTLVGGLLGAAFGGIMGYFGGEKIAKGIQDVADWAYGKFQSIVDSVKTFFTGLPEKIGGFISEAYDSLVTWSKEKIDSIRESISGFMDSVETYVKKLFTLDYWLGRDSQVQNNPPKIMNSEEFKNMSAETQDRKPLRVEIAPNREVSGLVSSFDSFAKLIESQPRAVAKEAMTQSIYDRSIENSVTNNNTANNDYSRSNTQNVVSGSYNTATVNIASTPGARNKESSAFGTRSFINGGFGNPSRN